MIIIRIRHFLPQLLILGVLSFSSSLASKSEAEHHDQEANAFTCFPKELFAEVSKWLFVPDIIRASEVSKEWSQTFNQESVWKNIVQTIPGYQEYKEQGISAKHVFIKLKEPQFYFYSLPDAASDLFFNKDGTLLYIVATQAAEDRHYVWSPGAGIKPTNLTLNELRTTSKSEDPQVLKIQDTIRYTQETRDKENRLIEDCYRDDILDSLLNKQIFIENPDLFKKPLCVSIKATGIRSNKHIVAGQVQFECRHQDVPYIYIENRGAEVLETFFSQAHILPKNYKIQKVINMSADGAVFAGLGSQFSVWVACFPNVAAFKRHGMKVFDYQECGIFNTSLPHASIDSQAAQQPNQSAVAQTTSWASSPESYDLRFQDFGDLRE
jgi:hypothetical protein